MKKYILTLSFLAFIMNLSAQNTFPSNGNVGVGTVSPENKLDIISNNDRIAIRNATIALVLGQWDTQNNRIESVGRPLYLTTYTGAINFGINGATNLTVANSGNIGIGTESPKEKLSVNGKIRATEIKVETANWPDYVFADKYSLMPLADLEKYIAVNRHLPEMPSAKEIEVNGQNLGEMNSKLLKSVEELTLRLIDKDKQLQQQQTKSDLQELRIERLENVLSSFLEKDKQKK